MPPTQSKSSHPPKSDLPVQNTGVKFLQENDLTQQCKQLISSLPKDEGWAVPHFYQYQGFWHSSWQLQGVLTCQHHFRARDTDILLATTPKSGTTWLKAVVYSLVNRAVWAPQDHNDHPLMTSSPHDLVPFLELDVYVDHHKVPDLTTLPSPRIFSTHLPISSLPESVKETGCKVVYLCRDPRDTFVSLWHFENKMRPQEMGKLSLEEAFDKFCKGVSIYGPFWDHVLGYWKCSLDNPNKVFFLKYEDLKEEPVLHLKRLAEFCGCPFTIEETNEGLVEEIIKLCSFDSLSNLEVNNSGMFCLGIQNKLLFRKGDVGDWANYLSPEMIEQFDKINKENLHPWGLKL